MQITAQAQFTHNLARWQELLADQELARLPHRIETDRLGRIIMTPPPFFEHVWRIARIIELLHTHLPAGKTLSETPLSTADGVKVMDVAWLGSDYVKVLEQQRPLILEHRRIWVVGLQPSPRLPDPLLRQQSLLLERDFTLVLQRHFRGIDVTLWLRRGR